jgi:integral membrane sensor domain MASE1
MQVMRLLAVYVVFVVIGDVLAYAIGRGVEHWSATASLPVFLACFFIVFWAAWRLAVRVT